MHSANRPYIILVSVPLRVVWKRNFLMLANKVTRRDNDKLLLLLSFCYVFCDLACIWNTEKRRTGCDGVKLLTLLIIVKLRLQIFYLTCRKHHTAVLAVFARRFRINRPRHDTFQTTGPRKFVFEFILQNVVFLFFFYTTKMSRQSVTNPFYRLSVYNIPSVPERTVIQRVAENTILVQP